MGNIKKFEDFFDKMRGLLDNAKKQGHIIVRVEDIENTFPELKESEDEKIRKKLISFVKNWDKGGIVSKYTSNANDIKRILAWLEKQGKNSVRWNENTDGNKPQKNHSVLMKTVHGIAEGEWNGDDSWIQYRWVGIVRDSDVFSWMELSDLEKQGEQDARYKYLEELLVADDIYQMSMNKAMVEEAKSKAVNALSKLEISKLLGLEKQGEQNLIMAKSPQLGEQKPAGWSEEDENIKQWIISDIEKLFSLNKKSSIISDKEIIWLKSLKDRVGCAICFTTTKEWSESDKEEFQIAIDTLVEAGQHDSAHWLKSLKDRCTWKPTEEQIRALHDLNLTGNISYEGQGQILIELYNNLKKLTE